MWQTPPRNLARDGTRNRRVWRGDSATVPGPELLAAGLSVGGIGRTARPADPDLGDVRPWEELYAALAEADYVVLAAPLTDLTRDMIDAAALAAMRPSARLINVGRGGLVDEKALVEAL